MRKRLGGILLIVFFSGTGAFAQTFMVRGEVKKETKIGPEIVSRLPVRTFVSGKGDRKTVYKGVGLFDILNEVGIIVDTMPNGKPESTPQYDFHKRALRNFVVVRASDGYEVVFSMGELDKVLVKDPPFVAFYKNDRLLDKEGAMIVVPTDVKRKMRWVHGIEEITVLRVSK